MLAIILAAGFIGLLQSASIKYEPSETSGAQYLDHFDLTGLNATELADLIKQLELQEEVPYQPEEEEPGNVTTFQGGNCECGRINARKRIVGGTEPRRNKYPGLCYLSIPVSGGGAACGAALIDGWNALTAAHCVKGMTRNPTMYCGIHRTDGSNLRAGATIQVSKVLMHEQYDRPQFDNDIAVLQLATQAPCTSSVSPLCLPRSPADYEEKLCLAAGWGELSWGRSTSVLQEMTTTVQNPTRCRLRGNYNRNTMICLDTPSSGKSLCRGDSGGPIMCQGTNGRYVVAGLNSFVADHCQYPNASAKTFHFLSWIAPRLKRG